MMFRVVVSLVQNGIGQIPLIVAIHNCAGREVIETPTRGTGGKEAALWQHPNLNCGMHLLLEYLLTSVWIQQMQFRFGSTCQMHEAARYNEEGMIPTEVCKLFGVY
jgi:hypothetical protein